MYRQGMPMQSRGTKYKRAEVFNAYKSQSHYRSKNKLAGDLLKKSFSDKNNCILIADDLTE